MREKRLAVALCALAVTYCAVVQSQEPAEPAGPSAADSERLQRVESEIADLEADLERLATEKRSVLGEWNRLDATLNLRKSELEAAGLNLAAASERLEEHDAALARIDQAQLDRRRYLDFRLREIYKAGSERDVQRMLGAGDRSRSYWDGLHYAEVLSERDGKILREFRGDSERAVAVRAELVAARDELLAAHEELVGARDRAADARRQRQRMLDGLRQDEKKQKEAIRELRAAAKQLSGFARTAPQMEVETASDGVRDYQGTLDWPAQGPLRSGFGQRVHPTFRTKVPHPGWDIGATFGSDVRSVFDGEVVYSDWMRGYGLTCIVNHGDGVISVYAHASMLLVHLGDMVKRGQLLAKVGDTGSLNGTHLYFELRVDGRPVDPRRWLTAN